MLPPQTIRLPRAPPNSFHPKAYPCRTSISMLCCNLWRWKPSSTRKISKKFSHASTVKSVQYVCACANVQLHLGWKRQLHAIAGLTSSLPYKSRRSIGKQGSHAFLPVQTRNYCYTGSRAAHQTGKQRSQRVSEKTRCDKGSRAANIKFYV